MKNKWALITQNLYKVDNYRRMSELYDTIYKIILDYYNRKQKKLKILDIGCGDGSLLIKMKNLGYLYGVDISVENLKIAKRGGINTFYCNIDEKKLPFSKNFFDIIICTEVIEHVLIPDFLLLEAHRVLKKNSLFILTTPNLASLGKRFFLLFNKNPYIECSPLEKDAVGHLRYFIYSTLKNIIIKYNFKLIRFTSDVINFDSKGLIKSTFLAKIFPQFGRTIIFVLTK